MTEGCFTVIIAPTDGRVLLVRRRDIPLWDLPGGRRETAESSEECAIRETREETGLEVQIRDMVGEYQRPAADDLQHVFRATIIGGEEIRSGSETAKLRWFPPHRLPLFMAPHRRGQIRDALHEETPVMRVLRDQAWVLAVARMVARFR